MAQIRVLAITLLALLFAATAEAQSRDGRHSSGCEAGPIAALISLQKELGFTAGQTARLEAIDLEMETLNDPLVAELMEVRRDIRRLGKRENFTSDQRLLFEQYVDRAKPLMKSISENNRRAMHEVGVVLTDDQKARIGDLLRERNAFRDRHGDDSDCFRRRN